MKPKCIGIVGGAGPLAGAFLLERILVLSGKEYGCFRDADFPKVILISFPFSEMLERDMDIAKLQKELSECLTQLRNNGAEVLAIACNTLHVFLDEKDDSADLVHLPRAVSEVIKDQPLVFCTSTSARFGLHKQFFSCTYPDDQAQQKVDEIIDQILRGIEPSIVCPKLEKLFQAQTANTLVLGCTELSLLASHLLVPNKQIIDPLELLAQRIIQKSFTRS